MILTLFIILMIVVITFFILSLITDNQILKIILSAVIFGMLSYLTFSSFDIEQRVCNPNIIKYSVLNTTSNTTYDVTLTESYYCENQRINDNSFSILLFGFFILSLVYAFYNIFIYFSVFF